MFFFSLMNSTNFYRVEPIKRILQYDWYFFRIYTYDPPIHDITFGCKAGAKQQDGRPMLFGFFITFTRGLKGILFFSEFRGCLEDMLSAF